MNLKQSVAIVTGASQGLGFSVAKAFLEEGATVAICARDAERLDQARKALLEIVHDESKIIAKALDVSDVKAVNDFIDDVHQRVGRIDILVSNAGIYGPKGSIDEVDWNEWCYTLDVNLKGSVIVSRAVLPYLKKQKSGKMIFLSGGGATKPLPFLSAYAVSKAAIVRYAETLSEELKSFNIDVNTIAPGALNTRLLDEVLEAGADKIGGAFHAQCMRQKEEGGASLENAAALCVYLASSASDGMTGKLISAVWDPWQQLNTYKDQLSHSDIYTLRRIVPEDRGFSWPLPSE